MSKDQTSTANSRLAAAYEQGKLPSRLHESSLWKDFGSAKALKSHGYVMLGEPLVIYALEGLPGAAADAFAVYTLVFEALNRLWEKTFT